MLVTLVFIGGCLGAAPLLNHVLSMMLMMCHFMRMPRLWLGRMLLVLTNIVLPRMRIMVPTCMLVVLSIAAWLMLTRVAELGSFLKGTARLRTLLCAAEVVGRHTRPHATRSLRI